MRNLYSIKDMQRLVGLSLTKDNKCSRCRCISSIIRANAGIVPSMLLLCIRYIQIRGSESPVHTQNGCHWTIYGNRYSICGRGKPVMICTVLLLPALTFLQLTPVLYHLWTWADFQNFKSQECFTAQWMRCVVCVSSSVQAKHKQPLM